MANMSLADRKPGHDSMEDRLTLDVEPEYPLHDPTSRPYNAIVCRDDLLFHRRESIVCIYGVCVPCITIFRRLRGQNGLSNEVGKRSGLMEAQGLYRGHNGLVLGAQPFRMDSPAAEPEKCSRPYIGSKADLMVVGDVPDNERWWGFRRTRLDTRAGVATSPEIGVDPFAKSIPR